LGSAAFDAIPNTSRKLFGKIVEFNSNSFDTSAIPSAFFRSGHSINHCHATSVSLQASTTSGRDRNTR